MLEHRPVSQGGDTNRSLGNEHPIAPSDWMSPACQMRTDPRSDDQWICLSTPLVYGTHWTGECGQCPGGGKAEAKWEAHGRYSMPITAQPNRHAQAVFVPVAPYACVCHKLLCGCMPQAGFECVLWRPCSVAQSSIDICLSTTCTCASNIHSLSPSNNVKWRPPWSAVAGVMARFRALCDTDTSEHVQLHLPLAS